MKVFPKFKEIEKLKSIQDKHREWLKDYEGQIYSIAEDGKHKIKWVTESRRYRNKIWSPEINCIKELPYRLRIEFDDKDEKGNKDKEKIKENLEKVKKILHKKQWGYIESTHNGASNYLWIEFNRNLTQKEKEVFLYWIAPENSEIDLNFASSRRVFPVLFAIHWKYSLQREIPIYYFKGERINADELDLKYKEKPLRTNKNGYLTSTKTASQLFTRRGQAKEFVKIQPLFYDQAGIWWRWNKEELKWEVSDEVEILNDIFREMQIDTINSSARNEILNSLKQVGRETKPKPIKKTWIQFKDKVYDIETGENFKASSEYFVTNPIPWKISGDPRTPKIDKIFEQWVGKDYVKLLHEIIAYCCLPDYPIHRLFCLIGSGLNGKSKFLELLRRFISERNICSTELDTLISSRFEITRLHKRLVCMMGETNFNEISKTSILKKLTGQDTIGFEYKNKNPFEDYNYAKILIATNNLPTTTDKTIGFYRRWLIIDFPNKFSEKKDILKEIPEEEYNNLATNVLTIIHTLLKEREFTNEGPIEVRQQKYEEKSNFLEKFIKLFVEEDVEGYITKNDFKIKFREWCKENNHREMSDTSIGLKMKERGYESSTKYFDWLHDGRGGYARIWFGIKWK